jgi:hypothetical protein
VQRSRVGAVHVEVLEDDELGADRSGGADDSSLEWWELLGPAVVVGSVEAEVHGGGTLGDRSEGVVIGHVAAYRLDAGQGDGAGSVDQSNRVALVGEGGGDGAAGGTGAEHDVTVARHDGTVLAGTNIRMKVLWSTIDEIAP